MLKKVTEFVVGNRLIMPGDKVLAACSGGPDSLVLADILRMMLPTLRFDLAIAHVNHMFRGEESTADEQFVADYCQRHGLAYYSTAINIPQRIEQEGGSAEDVARRHRYAFLRQVAADWGNAKIATGHHRDDQAETVLLHLFRGAGGAGLSGMQADSAGIIRPLLAVSRREIEEYCRCQGLEPRLDSSNLSVDYLRNRIRLCVIPQLEQQLEINVREPLCRTAQIISDEQDFFRRTAIALLPELSCETDEAVFIFTKRLAEQHIALKRHIFRLLIEKKHGSLTGITFHHVEKLIEMAELWPVGSRLDLPGGWKAERGYDSVTICRSGAIPERPFISPPGVQLQIPGVTEIPALGLQVRAEVVCSLPGTLAAKTAVFDLDALPGPLYVRTRQPGDRFSPRGMQGEKKVKKFLIDKKIDHRLRDSIPIFCDCEGRIFWLGGLRGARHGQITPDTSKYLVLQFVTRS